MKRKFIHKSTAIILLFSLLFSSCGVVMYSHLCEMKNHKFVSLYIDNTENQCEAANQAEYNNHQHTSSTCCKIDDANNCCSSHNVKKEVKRLSIKYINSDRHNLTKSIPLVIITYLFSQNNLLCKLNSENKFSNYKAPPFISKLINTGKYINIKNSSLKLYC